MVLMDGENGFREDATRAEGSDHGPERLMPSSARR
jgi:hypothetical protein